MLWDRVASGIHGLMVTEFTRLFCLWIFHGFSVLIMGLVFMGIYVLGFVSDFLSGMLVSQGTCMRSLN